MTLIFYLKKIFFLIFLLQVVTCMRQINIDLSTFFLKYWKNRPKNHADHYIEHPIHNYPSRFKYDECTFGSNY